MAIGSFLESGCLIELHQMITSSSTDEGFPIRCDICGTSSIVHVSRPPGDSVCPNCGSFLWVNAVIEVTSRHQFVPDIRLKLTDAPDRNAAIRQIVDAMAAERDWSTNRIEEFIAAILNREELGSTGIGRGFAIPHASIDWIENSVTVMAFAPDGIDFSSLDGNPVHTVIMLASPQSDPGTHLKTLERISRSLRFIGNSAR